MLGYILIPFLSSVEDPIVMIVMLFLFKLTPHHFTIGNQLEIGLVEFDLFIGFLNRFRLCNRLNHRLWYYFAFLLYQRNGLLLAEFANVLLGFLLASFD